MNPDIISGLVAIVFCVVMSAYFSATETAFSSLNKTRMKALAEKGNKKANLTLSLVEQYDKLISTILIGNNIVNIMAASFGTLLFVELLKSPDLGATVSTAVVTVTILIFGEITPKSIAKDMPESVAMFASPFLRVLMFIFAPLNFVFSQWKKMIAKLFKVNSETKRSQEEMLLLVEEVQQEGSIDETEGELLRNAIEFREQVVEDILTHRTDLEAVSVDASKEEISATFTQSGFSRLLVYEDTIDRVVGVVNWKDFYVGKGWTEKSLTEIMTLPIFVHQSVKIRDLLRQLQAEKAHLAVVVDEYGGTLGIVTMEDILEELVGQIWDEHDEVREEISELSESSFRVDGMLNLDEFREMFDLDFESESVSLGGWVMEQIGAIPTIGDEFEFENLKVVVSEMDEHRVSFVTVTVLEPAKTAE